MESMQNNTTEVWLPFCEDPAYLVSNLGRIKTTKKFYNRMHSGKLLTVKSRHDIIVGSALSKKGYSRVRLGKRTYQTHRVVALTWLPNPEKLPQVNHIDGDKLNNSVTNLEWVTNQQNRNHAVRTGLQARGSRVSRKLVETDVIEIRRLVDQGMSQRNVAKIFNLVQQTVSRIVRRQTWIHI